MHYPALKKYPITQDFGQTEFANQRGDEIYYFFDGKHPGLDFAMPVGEPVFATLPGFVTSIEYHRGMGKTIRIRYGNIQHIYGHLSKFNVHFGDFVEEGQQVGLSGDTVAWSGPHLHFEMRDLAVYEVNQRPFNPDFSLKLPVQFKEIFVYEANHNQALVDLALKFYGAEVGIKILKEANPVLRQRESHKILEKGTKVIVSLNWLGRSYSRLSHLFTI